MNYAEGALFGLVGCLLYQLANIYQYRKDNKKWPWSDKKNHLTPGFFTFGFVTKLFIAAILAGLMTLTNQISGAWAAFLVGMVAERIIIVLGDKALKEVAK